MFSKSITKMAVLAGAALGMTAASALADRAELETSSAAQARATACLLIEMQRTDGGYVPSQGEMEACSVGVSSLGAMGREGLVAKSTKITIENACFLIELQRTDGYEPSVEENTACMAERTRAKQR